MEHNHHLIVRVVTCSVLRLRVVPCSMSSYSVAVEEYACHILLRFVSVFFSCAVGEYDMHILWVHVYQPLARSPLLY